MRHRRGWGGRGRPPKPVFLGQTPVPTKFTPNVQGRAPHPTANEPVELSYPELEALRLVDREGLDQEQAGAKMGVSRGTVWRLLSEARRKVATALTDLRPIQISPAD
jgi:predicted DNA-binding protein (UPF0251 family)